MLHSESWDVFFLERGWPQASQVCYDNDAGQNVHVSEREIFYPIVVANML